MCDNAYSIHAVSQFLDFLHQGYFKDLTSWDLLMLCPAHDNPEDDPALAVTCVGPVHSSEEQVEARAAASKPEHQETRRQTMTADQARVESLEADTHYSEPRTCLPQACMYKVLGVLALYSKSGVEDSADSHMQHFLRAQAEKHPLQ